MSEVSLSLSLSLSLLTRSSHALSFDPTLIAGMDLELEDQQHTLADTVESSQAMNLDQGTGEGTANGGGGGAASTGDQGESFTMLHASSYS